MDRKGLARPTSPSHQPPGSRELTLFLYSWPAGSEDPESILVHAGPHCVRTTHRRAIRVWPDSMPPVASSGAAVLAALAVPLCIQLHRRSFRLLKRIEDLERRLVLGHARRLGGLEREILNAKREAGRLVRTLEEQRDGIARARRVLDEGGRLQAAARLSRRALRHAERARQEAQTLLDGHFASQSIRLGEIVKALTLMTTILVPSSLVAALYGMNFAHLPMADHPLGFWMVLGIMAFLVGSLMWLFRRRRWL